MTRRHQSGQAMVEAALVLPLLLMLVFGCLELGHAALFMQTLDDAAREGARWSAMPAENTQTLPAVSAVEQRVINVAAASNLTLTDSDITVNQDVTATQGGESVTFSQVDVTSTYTFLTPLLSDILPTITLQGHALMRNETN